MVFFEFIDFFLGFMWMLSYLKFSVLFEGCLLALGYIEAIYRILFGLDFAIECFLVVCIFE